jgi:hypothetical protein
MVVDGAWNNFEGLPDNYTEKIHDVLAAEGCVRSEQEKQLACSCDHL